MPRIHTLSDHIYAQTVDVQSVGLVPGGSGAAFDAYGYSNLMVNTSCRSASDGTLNIFVQGGPTSGGAWTSLGQLTQIGSSLTSNSSIFNSTASISVNNDLFRFYRCTYVVAGSVSGITTTYLASNPVQYPVTQTVPTKYL